MSIIHVISMSTGKDSCATLAVALETQPRESIRIAFADTGNENEAVYEHLDHIERVVGLPIVRLRRDFSAEVLRQRDEIVMKLWPTKGMPMADCLRAAAALVPTGNPFLDLCLWKGRFPSRRALFCTQFLKTEPLVEYQLGLIEAGECDAVWSWQGVRIEESESRRTRLQGTGACVVAFDDRGGGIYNYRPILRWQAADAFEASAIAGIKPNPLYLQGMSRVGCMPCINASKDEVLAISKRFPAHIDRVEYWEQCAAMTSKRMEASFFPDPDRDAHLNKRGIRNMVEWSKTQRGGKNLDFIRIMEEPKACESAYGLCE